MNTITYMNRGGSTMPPVWARIGMATAEMAIISRSTLRRPRVSDIQPDKIRPAALPTAPMRIAVVASASGTPWLRANGTSWLITMSPAAVSREVAIHIREKVGGLKVSLGEYTQGGAASLVSGTGNTA